MLRSYVESCNHCALGAYLNHQHGQLFSAFGFAVSGSRKNNYFLLISAKAS